MKHSLNLLNNPNSKRVCSRCGQKFHPTSRRGRVCPACYKKEWLAGLEKRYGRKIKVSNELSNYIIIQPKRLQ